MNKEIIDLNNLRQDKINLYNHTKEIVDEKTGEVTSSIHSFTKQAKTKDEFVKLYIENIDFLQTLGGSEMKILFFAIKNLNYTNSFSFSKNFIAYFVENKILGKTAVYRNFNLLVDKKVFIKSSEEMRKEVGLYGDDIYFVNPNIVGKGSFINLEKLKRTIVQTFDFKNLKMTEEISTESQYEGFDKILNNPSNYAVDSIKSKKMGNTTYNEILISEKDEYYEPVNTKPKNNDENIVDISIDDDKSNTENLDSKTINKDEAIIAKFNNEKELEYTMVQAENEKRRLENENLRLKIEILKLEKLNS